MKPITQQEFKTLEKKARAGHGARIRELLEFIESGCRYAELPRFWEADRVVKEREVYGTCLCYLVNHKEVLPHIITIRRFGDRIIAVNKTIPEEE